MEFLQSAAQGLTPTDFAGATGFYGLMGIGITFLVVILRAWTQQFRASTDSQAAAMREAQTARDEATGLREELRRFRVDHDECKSELNVMRTRQAILESTLARHGIEVPPGPLTWRDEL